MAEPIDETALELKITKCQLAVYKDMHDMRKDVHIVTGRVSDLEKGQELLHKKLDKHELQRRTMHEESDEKLGKLLDLVEAIGTESNKNAQWISKENKLRLKILSAVAGIVGFVTLLYWLYNFLEDHGVVFIIENGSK